MGINRDTSDLLRSLAAAGADFSRTLTLGRQDLYGMGSVRPADDLFRELGAERLDSLDASDYEGASIVHDLNAAIPSDLRGNFTVVFDGGTIEHVFDAPGALRRALELVAVGGHYVAASPGNNQMGHGFYQFSPNFYFEGVRSSGLGFEVLGVFAVERRFGRAQWYACVDPAMDGRRFQLRSASPVELVAVARRVAASDTADERPAPQQSDYVEKWATPTEAAPASKKQRLRAAVPAPAVRLVDAGLTRWRTSWRNGGFRAIRASELVDVLA